MSKLLIVIFGLAGVFALHAADGDVLATTQSAESFKFNTSDVSPFAMVSITAVTDFFAEMPVTWLSDETVIEEAPDGTATTVSAASAGSYAFSPTSSGVWTLSNSEGGKVYVSIPWGVTGGAVCTSGASAFAIDTNEGGPNRKSYKREVLPIAYSGDGWDKSKTSVSTLTLMSSAGEETNVALTGTGVIPVTFSQTGDWTLSLAMEDGTTLGGILTIIGQGLIISFH